MPCLYYVASCLFNVVSSHITNQFFPGFSVNCFFITALDQQLSCTESVYNVE